MRYIFLILILLTFPLPAQTTERDTGLDIAFSLYGSAALADINAALRDIKAAPLGENQYAWGMSLEQSSGSWMQFYDFSTQYGFSSYESGAKLSSRYRLTDVLFGGGYPLGDGAPFRIIPKAALGLRFAALDIKPDALEKITWQDLANSNKAILSLYESALALYAGVRLEYTLTQKESDEGRVRVPLALEWGYFFTAYRITEPAVLNSAPGDIHVSGAPELLPHGWRLTLTIGFRGYSKEKQPVFYNGE
ncbi:MAG: hypothetical protein D6677_01065 [Calditrichaeota bacterium]|nr:MAG: hypothetical protein D6677_01065 [Calditrichota bacterium]